MPMSGFKRGARNIRPTRQPRPEPRKGRWFAASFSSGECSDCGVPITEGDHIRADGAGGWECREHEEEGPDAVVTEYIERDKAQRRDGYR